MLRSWRSLLSAVTPVLLGAAILTAPATAAAAGSAPFHAAFGEQFGPAACPPNTPPGMLCAAATGIGSAVGITPGPVTESVLGVVDLTKLNPATACAPDNASGTLTASSGDHVNVTTTGTFCMTSRRTARDSGTFQISGGTGRLAGVTASGTFVTYAVIVSGFSGRSASTYQGTISLPDRPS